MPPYFYSILHVASAVLLVAVTFQAFADKDAQRRKKVMMTSGILSFVMLVGGFGLLAKFKYGFPLWVVVKMGCFLGLAAMAGAAYRLPGKEKLLSLVTVGLLVAALCMVYMRPM
ncbi:MAG: hypothetical protein ACYSU1_02230 [Planctomycetota bacterium]|jgi:hypothetical protein